MSQRLKLRLFGGFQLQDGEGAPITISLRKAEALLAYLAVAPGQRASRETLATLLWGEFEQQRARQSLRQTLLALTKALAKSEVQVLRMESQTVSLMPDSLWVDAVELVRLLDDGSPEALDQAPALYQGELVAGLAVDAPDFEDWLTLTRGRLHDQALKALTDLLNSQVTRDDIDSAIETANQALRVDAYREDIHRQLMQMYIEKGMRSSALAQYRTCRDVLERELGVQPDEQTIRLYKSILEQGGSDARSRPALPPPQQRSADAAPIEAASERKRLFWSDRPIGRDQELATLEGFLREAMESRRRAVAVVGEAGIGKSYLLDSFLDSCPAEDIRILRLVGRRADQGLYLTPWKEMLRSLIGDNPDLLAADEDNPIRAFLRGEWGAKAGTAAGNLERLQLFDALNDLFQTMAHDCPLVIRFEDLHWADNESLRLLSYAIRQLASAPILFLFALRSEDGSGNGLLVDLLDDLAENGHLVWLMLKPLTQLECAELVHQIETKLGLGEEVHKEADQVWTLSEGNPQVIVEHTVPQSVREARRELFGTLFPRVMTSDAQRIRANLSDGAGLLLSMACVLGPRSNYEVLMHAAELDARATAQAIEELVGRQILSVETDDVVFVRLRVCRALYEDLVPPRRQLLHAACVQAMEQVYHDRLEEHYQSLAYHAREGEQYGHALAYQVRAARVEINRGALGAAGKLLRLGLKAAALVRDEPSSLALEVQSHVLLAEIEERSESLNRATSHLKTAQRIARRAPDPSVQLHVLLGQSRLSYRRGQLESAVDFARRALACGEAKAIGQVWSGPAEFLARFHLVAGRDDGVIEDLRRSVERCAAADLGVQGVETAVVLTLALALRSNFQEAGAHCQDALDRAETIGSEASMATCLFGFGVLSLWSGAAERAVDQFERAVIIAEARGDLLKLYLTKGFLGVAQIANEQPAEGVALLEEATGLARQVETRFFLAYFKAVLAEAWPESENETAGITLAEEALSLANETNQPWARSIAYRAKAQILARQHASQLPDAELAVKRAIAFQRGLKLNFEVVRSLVTQARIVRARGDSDRAIALYRSAAQLYQDLGQDDEAKRIETLAQALRPSSAAS